MARTPKIVSVYDKLNKIEQDIVETENRLKKLISERAELLKEKDELEMKKLWAYLKEQNLSFEEVQNLISNNKQIDSPEEWFMI